MRNLVLWGATGQARVLAEFVDSLGYRVVAVFDIDPAVLAPFPGIPLFRGAKEFAAWRVEAPEGALFGLAAVGGARGRDRLEIQELFEQNGVRPATVAHPAAYVAGNATLGEGTQVLAGAVVGAEANLGRACIVNTRASVDHECVLGDGVHVAPGAVLGGCVTVDELAFVAMGAVVLPRVRIGRGAVVGAGAVVTRDVPAGKVVYGNPARVIRDVDQQGDRI